MEEVCDRCGSFEVVDNHTCEPCLVAEENYYIEQHNRDLPEGEEPAEFITKW